MNVITNYYVFYFWRTSQQQEVDYVEENAGTISGFEFKWNPKRKAKLPKTFIKKYNATETIISKDNFRDFIII